MRTFATWSTTDSFQNYIPVYVLGIRSWSDDPIVIFVKGELRQRVKNALAIIGKQNVTIVEDQARNYPDLVATISALRFTSGYNNLLRDSLFSLITDIDMLILNDPWEWFISRANGHDAFFSGYHGAWNKPYRPEVCPRWEGDYERVAGGLFCMRQDWWEKTLNARKIYNEAIKNGTEGHYRECDEVILAKIIKKSGTTIPDKKDLPSQLRGLHFGDFKFEYRISNKKKMNHLLHGDTIQKYRVLKETARWKDVIEELDDEELKSILKTVDNHLECR